MTLLSEQLSAASSQYLTTPMNAQLTVLGTLATQALDNASRITALNLSTTQDLLERSAQTARQLIGARDARDLAVLRSHAEQQVRSLLAYNRELFGIVTSAQPLLPRSVTPEALAAPVPVPPAPDAGKEAAETAQAAAERTIEAVADAAPLADIVASAPQETVPEVAPAMALATAPARPTPIAQAAGNGAVLAATPAEPAAAPIERRDPDAPTSAATPRRRRK